MKKSILDGKFREPKMTFANGLTTVRVILGAVGIWALRKEFDHIGSLTSAIALLTDSIDGWTARNLDFCGPTKFGAIYDRIADKLIVACIFIVLSMRKKVPWWATAALVAGETKLGYLAIRAHIENAEGRAHWSGKAKMIAECLGLTYYFFERKKVGNIIVSVAIFLMIRSINDHLADLNLSSKGGDL